MADRILKDEEYGKEFLDELMTVLEIRKDRRKIYGDSFKNTSIYNLQAIIEGKLIRATDILNLHGIKHPKYRDEISDVINYMIFLLYGVRKAENE